MKLFFSCLPMKQSMSLVHTTVVKMTIFSWQFFVAGLYSLWKALKIFISCFGWQKLQSQEKNIKNSQQQCSDLAFLDGRYWSMRKDGLSNWLPLTIVIVNKEKTDFPLVPCSWPLKRLHCGKSHLKCMLVGNKVGNIGRWSTMRQMVDRK